MNKKKAKKIRKDIRVLADLTEVYCKRKHPDEEKAPIDTKGTLAEYTGELSVTLCSECTKLVLHGSIKRAQCPLDPKPACKHCPEHCYQPKYRDQVREVMRFSWKYLLKRGRLDLVLKHL